MKTNLLFTLLLLFPFLALNAQVKLDSITEYEEGVIYAYEYDANLTPSKITLGGEDQILLEYAGDKLEVFDLVIEEDTINYDIQYDQDLIDKIIITPLGTSTEIFVELDYHYMSGALDSISTGFYEGGEITEKGTTMAFKTNAKGMITSRGTIEDGEFLEIERFAYNDKGQIIMYQIVEELLMTFEESITGDALKLKVEEDGGGITEFNVSKSLDEVLYPSSFYEIFNVLFSDTDGNRVLLDLFDYGKPNTIAQDEGTQQTVIEYHYSMAVNTEEAFIVGTGITVYPNPTSDFIQFEDTSIETVTIYSVDGQAVLQVDAIDNRIDVSTLSTGSYVLHGQNKAGKKYISKFIKH